MNIAVQCCGMAVLIILFLFYIQKKNLATRTEHVFRCSFLAIAFCLFMDILSIVAITFQAKLSLWLVNAVCKFYLMTLVLSMLFALLYIWSDILTEEKHWRLCVRVCSLFALAIFLCICTAPISIYNNLLTKETYTYGPAVLITYAGVIVMLINNIVLLITQKKMNVRRRRAVAIWMGMWICAAVVQFFHKELLIVGFAAAMGIMVVYLQFENPELNLDRETGLFNQGAFMMYMQQLYEQKQDLPVMSVRVYRFHDGKQPEAMQEHIIRQLARILLAMPNLYVFRVNEAELVLLFRKKERAEHEADDIYRRIESEFRLYGDHVFKPYYFYTDSLQIVGSGSELLELMHYARVKNGEAALGKFLKIDAQTAERLFYIKNMEHQINDISRQSISIWKSRNLLLLVPAMYCWII